jgi:hypothetical protein
LFPVEERGFSCNFALAAGGALGFIADQGINHPRPVQFYIAKTPERKSIDSWDGSGQVWFKVAFLGDKITPNWSNGRHIVSISTSVK